MHTFVIFVKQILDIFCVRKFQPDKYRTAMLVGLIISDYVSIKPGMFGEWDSLAADQKVRGRDNFTDL